MKSSMPTFTIISCALAVVYSGGGLFWSTVILDVVQDVDQVKSKITERDSRHYAGAYIWTSGGYGSDS